MKLIREFGTDQAYEDKEYSFEQYPTGRKTF